MTRGRRQGYVTKEELTQRLLGFDASFDLQKSSASELLGHAVFYKLVTDHEKDETIARTETTTSCYLRTHAVDERKQQAIESYVIAASELYFRGSTIANLAVITDLDQVNWVVGQRFDGQVQERLASMANFLDPPDVRNAEFKQVFLPERWPSGDVPRCVGDFRIVCKSPPNYSTDS